MAGVGGGAAGDGNSNPCRIRRSVPSAINPATQALIGKLLVSRSDRGRKEGRHAF